MASKKVFKIDASVRHDLGKGASRRLRRNKHVPGVVYGGKQEAVALSLEHKQIIKHLEDEAFYSQILDLQIDDKSEMVVLKDLQRHSHKPQILHVDFQRVSKHEKMHTHLPIHFIGEDKAPGVKEGGMISHTMSDVEIACLPADLPEFLELDLSEMKLDETKHLSDIPLPKGVEIIALSHHDDDRPVVSIHMPRVEEEPEPEEAVEAGDVPATEQKAEGEEAKAEGGDEKKEGDKK